MPSLLGVLASLRGTMPSQMPDYAKIFPDLPKNGAWLCVGDWGSGCQHLLGSRSAQGVCARIVWVSSTAKLLTPDP